MQLTSTSELSSILPHLFISDWGTSQDVKKLARQNIQAVLTVEQEPKSSQIQNLYHSHNIDFMQISLDDHPGENISQYFNSTYDFIDKHIVQDQNVLVHCRAGVSRSVTIVANYLIRRLYERAKLTNTPLNSNEAITKALTTIKLGRPIANPNVGFIKQLQDAAQEYSKSYTKTDLNFIPTSNKMCDKSFTDSAGKAANVICLTDADFSPQGDLVNFKDVSGIVFFYATWCGHCRDTKPEYVKFANSIPPNIPVRAFSVDGVKEQALVSRINPMTWGYEVRGYPQIIGYANGKFYSEYAPDESKPGSFRKSEDFLDYAKGLGKAEVKIIRA